MDRDVLRSGVFTVVWCRIVFLWDMTQHRIT